MTLSKRYKRDLKHNLSLYVSSIILTVLALLMFYLYYIAGTGIQAFGKEFFREQKLEDANFTTYMPIPKDAIQDYEKEFDLELEEQKYINIETNEVVARVFDRTKKIDLYHITEGEDVKNDDEIIISQGYAEHNRVKIGDKIQIKDRKYKVTGYMERPDYLYMIQHLSDVEKNVTSFFLCYMTDEEFDRLEAENAQYLVRFHQENEDEFRKAVNEDYMMSSYLKAKDNIRIQMMEEQPKLFIQIAYVTLFTVPLLVVLLISIILSRKIKSEQKMIGTLVAYGYTNRQIIHHYVGFAAVPGVIGGVLTTIVIAFCAEPYGAMGLMDYEPLQAEFTLEPVQMLMGILIPTIMYILSTALTVRRLLKHEVTELLAGSVKGQKKVRKVWADKEVSFRLKFNLRSMIGNPGRSFVLFLGVFVGSFIIILAMATLDSSYYISTSTAENMKGYAYQYSLNELRNDEKYEGSTLLFGSAEDEDGRRLSLVGADGNDKINLKDIEGNTVKVEDEYYVTSLYAMFAKVEKGDEIELYNPLSLEKHKIKIAGIIDDNFSKSIYTSRSHVSELTGIDENCYNMILSNEKLDIPDNKIVSFVSRDALDEQYKMVISQMETIIHLMAGIGIVICIIAVYIAVNMIVTENKTNISMLRVLGYSDKKINRLLLNDNLYIVILALLVGIPCGAAGSQAMFASFVDILGYLIEIHIEPKSYAMAVGSVLIGYFVSLHFLKKKVAKVDMVESLKDNRE